MSTTTKELEPLYSTLAGDPDLAELVELFVSEMPARVKTVRDCLQRGDMDGLQRAAHQLKGAAGSYGFNDITTQAAQLENTVRNRRDQAEILTAVESLAKSAGGPKAGPPAHSQPIEKLAFATNGVPLLVLKQCS